MQWFIYTIILSMVVVYSCRWRTVLRLPFQNIDDNNNAFFDQTHIENIEYADLLSSNRRWNARKYDIIQKKHSFMQINTAWSVSFMTYMRINWIMNINMALNHIVYGIWRVETNKSVWANWIKIYSLPKNKIIYHNKSFLSPSHSYRRWKRISKNVHKL